MAERPILFLANWSSTRRPDPAVVGTGRRWTAMARPRAWGRGDGRVEALTPDLGDFDALRSGALAPAEYFRRCHARFGASLAAGDLAPGRLSARWLDGRLRPDGNPEPVEPGDAILCACVRAAALRGECHLAVAAPWLVRAGWDVRLFGRPVDAEGNIG